MKKILIALFLFCGTMAYGQSAFAKAEQLFQAEKYDQALIAFEKLNKQDASNKKVIERLGDIAGRKNDLETAITYYKKLVEREPSNANYNFKYGGTLGLHAKNVSKFKALGMLDDVKRHLQKAADLDTEHIEVRHALSQMYCELPGIVGGSIKKSRAYADELLAISPVDGHLAHGFIDEYQKEYDKAVVSYRKAIKTGGSMLTYRKLIAVYKDHLKDTNSTREVLKEAYKVHPSPSLKAEITALEKS
ncbi:tetratricopeptide repeat protein [Nonlabens dokdonensis]|uniref:Secreted TPR-repeat containing protein n=2 Tax=Nonlabens dokdonensis TaxID=328515 RepID=L7WAE1_NONDD|nr:tetratricopeptide repeat protein [Nonlabens dokdonensis]AGC77114.1 secreted TPR-repeat containing protein [Nonlabens dokdonensis DSW-6]PZX41073.1 tetratricopeptide repeat protein [Nonlabens dokdonensis]